MEMAAMVDDDTVKMRPQPRRRSTPRIEVRLGNIVDAECDAIVSSLAPDPAMQGAVDAALMGRAGESVARELDSRRRRHPRGWVPLAECVVTSAGVLSAKSIVHVATPTWDGTTSAVRALGNAYARALETAEEIGASVVALPALGAGRARFPARSAARVAFAAVKAARLRGTTVRFVISNRAVYAAFIKAFAEVA
jgi:O-acetyl-ADP-ribose deacetylase (regulator of RNase III)